MTKSGPLTVAPTKSTEEFQMNATPDFSKISEHTLTSSPGHALFFVFNTESDTGESVNVNSMLP